MKNIIYKRSSVRYSSMVKGALVILMLAMFNLHLLGAPQELADTCSSDYPVKVSVRLYVNRIFNINTVEESYQVDGYLFFSWHDKNVKFDAAKAINGSMIYENEETVDVICSKIWFPCFEFINVSEKPNTYNKSLEIRSNGNIYYAERFNGLFYSNANYCRFPFDSQCFSIMLESFSYDTRTLKYVNPELFPGLEESKSLLDKWMIKDMSARVEDLRYNHLNYTKDDTEIYSRAVFEIGAKRLSGYYVWQVLFPLLIIIVASFVVFWINDFATQIGIGFTLMLTVVAFNFFSSAILPKLPYNTFFEFVIMIGYVFIFLSIIAVIVNNAMVNSAKNEKKLKEINLLRLFRFSFPIAFIVTMLILTYSFFL